MNVFALVSISYLQHISLQPPQHVRPQHLVQLFDLLLLGDFGELRLEGDEVVELVRTEEVQQMEQFLQVVLQRRTRQQQLVPQLVGGQHLEELWVGRQGVS